MRCLSSQVGQVVLVKSRGREVFGEPGAALPAPETEALGAHCPSEGSPLPRSPQQQK